jgi:hypothetical protein
MQHPHNTLLPLLLLPLLLLLLPLLPLLQTATRWIAVATMAAAAHCSPTLGCHGRMQRT